MIKKIIGALALVFTMSCATDSTKSETTEEATSSSTKPQGHYVNGVFAFDKTPEDVSIVMRANANKIQDCYEQLLSRDANAKGKMTVLFKVKKDGTVASSKILTTSIDQEKFQKCVLDIVQQLRFPPTTADRTLEYPFTFFPKP